MKWYLHASWIKKSKLSKILLMNWYLHTIWVKKIKSFLRFWSLFKENWEICVYYIDDISGKKHNELYNTDLLLSCVKIDFQYSQKW